jgi:hypothetical protein
VGEEGGYLTFGGVGASRRKAGVGAGGSQKRRAGVEALACAAAARPGLDSVEESIGDHTAHTSAAAAATGTRAGLAGAATVVGGGAAVTELAAALSRLAAAVLRGRWTGGGEECCC